MGWRDHIDVEEHHAFPWTGERNLRNREVLWSIVGDLPPEYGWWHFRCHSNRLAYFLGAADARPEILHDPITGYLVGNRLVPDDARVSPDPTKIHECAEEVFLVEPGLDRFARISAGRMYDGGPLIFKQQEFPLGPETEALTAFLSDDPNWAAVAMVTPALDAAYYIECFQREEAKKRREAIEKERRRRELVEKLGDGAGRRAMAAENFGEAARAALAVGGATYLDHRKAARGHEMAVRFRLANRRFECTCDDRTLAIIDSGICLKDERTGEKGDGYFTLESLPSVVLQAIKEDALVVYRHVD